MLTGNLLHAARVLAGLDRVEVAAQAGLTPDAVLNLENAASSALPAEDRAVRQLKAALEKAGVEFLENGASGLRLRPGDQQDESIPTQDLNAENDG